MSKNKIHTKCRKEVWEIMEKFFAGIEKKLNTQNCKFVIDKYDSENIFFRVFLEFYGNYPDYSFSIVVDIFSEGEFFKIDSAILRDDGYIMLHGPESKLNNGSYEDMISGFLNWFSIFYYEIYKHENVILEYLKKCKN